MNGVLNINKPKGLSSFDVVRYVRKKLNVRRVGHAGTLDPLATGVLILLVGKSTKLFDQFVSFDKAYEATLRLGLTTDTADINGKVLKEAPYEHISQEQIVQAFQSFIGAIEQIPPMYSAVKINGERLYKLARKGIAIDREPRKITIKTLRAVHFCPPEMKFYLECTKGTYVRQLAEDVGVLLGCGGCIAQIKRTKVGPYTIEQSINLENVNESYLRPLS